MTTLNSSPIARFDDFEVDLRHFELRKAGKKIKVPSQPIQLLALLLERPGEVVSRQEIRERLWPDTFVDVDHSLSTAISKIREALEDSAAKPRYVETLSRRGYRFIGVLQNPKESGKSDADALRDSQHSQAAGLGDPLKQKHESFWAWFVPPR